MRALAFTASLRCRYVGALVALIALARPAFGQGDGTTPDAPKPPQINESSDWKTVAKEAWHQWWGKLIVGMMVLLTITRIYFATRNYLRRSAASGEGMFGGMLSDKRVKELVAAG